MSSKESYRVELRSAARHLSDRGLYCAAKWALELLVDLDVLPSASSSAVSARASAGPSTSAASGFRSFSHLHPDASCRRCVRSDSSAPASAEAAVTPQAGVSYVSTPLPADDGFDGGSNDRYLLAKSYFDCREYRRAVYVLENQTGKKAVFFRCYSLYLAGEKRKEEEMFELEGSLGKSDAVNRELISLERELSSLRRAGSIDSFGLYLYGIILKDKGCENAAMKVLVESVNCFPWNWSAWLELQALCTTADTLNNLNLKNHWMKDFFLASAYQELKMHEEALKRYERLLGVFQSSNYIQSQIATVLYCLRELDDAELIFEDLLCKDPHRVESMDVYSNLLYAKESFSPLSFLAHRVSLTDKYRPESCCIIANYYSLKGQHEKSVLYFRRAVKLNRKFLSAWTLMGHEYVEMKNTPAATDAYRRAIEINPRDYRAWYGLGQTYEVMSMPFYALYYFRKSSYLQPNDSRPWIAMAHLYESAPLQMLNEAIKCFKRAANCNDSEGIALLQLAKLHDALGHSERAAFFYKKDLDRMEAEERQGPNMVEAMFYLAKYYQTKKRFQEAEYYCRRLLDYTGPESETARSLLRGLEISPDMEHFGP
ncbi:anaphase-promoting complex subunit 8-like [Zingiber officinale]|uniref:anaphase-promoting complex subunit 8-like n=1 Tax=Zingiber officinale TaxID=94328 RepID=UPI001C4D5DF4|nr:anaphase-promoting complex subunit 8-like [Zingiber officinale]